MWEKQCSECGCSKDDTESSRDRTRGDGLSSRCKACQLVRTKAHYQRKKAQPNQALPRIKDKYCTGCRQYKLLAEFPPNVAGSMGLGAHCKPCHARESRRVTAIHREHGISILRTEKTCTLCHETLPIEKFWVARSMADGRRSACGRCDAARAREKRGKPR